MDSEICPRPCSGRFSLTICLFFYSNIFGLSLAHAGTLVLVTKLYDAVSDPVMGLIADRTNTRWGKYRPYLLWIAIPFAVAGILAFFTPQTDNYTFKHVYAYVTYILMMTVYTAINVPYGAMLGVMTDDSREKSVFSSFRMFFAFIGSFIAMGSFEPLLKLRQSIMGTLPAEWTLADSTPADWTIAVSVIGIVCAVLFILSFVMTRERVTELKWPRSLSRRIPMRLPQLLWLRILKLLLPTGHGGCCLAEELQFFCSTA